MRLELSEQCGRNARGKPVAGFSEGEAQATVTHQEVANLQVGRSLGFVLSKFRKYLLLPGTERFAVELFEEVGMAKVFVQQKDVAAKGALVPVESSGNFRDFGVAVVNGGCRNSGWVHGQR